MAQTPQLAPVPGPHEQTSAPAVPPASPDTGAAPAPEEADLKHPFRSCLMPDENRVPVVDEARRRLHETVCGASLWFDSLFGGGDLTAARQTYGRLEVINAYSQFDGDDTRVRFSARMPLPALEDRLSAFIGRDNDEDYVRGRSEGQGLRSQASEINQVDDWFAGLAYQLKDVYGVDSDVQLGAHGLAHPTVFLRVRAVRPFHLDDDNSIYERLTPFVNNHDRFGISNELDFDHTVSPSVLLRWGNAGTVSQESAGLEWRSALLLLHLLREQHAIAYELFIRGATEAPEPLAEYGGRAIYRLPMFRARMFMNLVAGYSWPRVDPALPRDGSFGTSLGLELPFGSRHADTGVRP